MPKEKTLFDLQKNHPVFNIIMHACFISFTVFGNYYCRYII